MRSDIVKGAVFPDYELPDHKGKSQKLSDLQQQDPVALVLARGGYCPKEDLQHQWMASMQREVKVGYCRFITISTAAKLETKEWLYRLGAHWPFLSDEEGIVQKDLEIQEYTNPKHDPMIPYTILLEPGLKFTGSTMATGTGVDRPRKRYGRISCNFREGTARLGPFRSGDPGKMEER